MALEDIFHALEEQAEKERDDILSAARAQAEAIAEDAAEQAEEIRAECVEKSEAATRLKAAKTLNSARLKAKKEIAAVKDTAMNDSFSSAGERLATARAEAWYADVFKDLAVEALERVEGEKVLLVDPADQAVAERTVSELGVDAEIRAEIASSGGLVVMTAGGRIMRRNTFEERLDKLRQSVQSEIAEILFS